MRSKVSSTRGKPIINRSFHQSFRARIPRQPKYLFIKPANRVFQLPLDSFKNSSKR